MHYCFCSAFSFWVWVIVLDRVDILPYQFWVVVVALLLVDGLHFPHSSFHLLDVINTIHLQHALLAALVQFSRQHQQAVGEARVPDFLPCCVELLVKFEGVLVQEGDESFKADYHYMVMVLHDLEDLGVADLLVHEDGVVADVDLSEGGTTWEEGLTLLDHHGVVARVTKANVSELRLELRGVDFYFVGGVRLHFVYLYMGSYVDICI